MRAGEPVECDTECDGNHDQHAERLERADARRNRERVLNAARHLVGVVGAERLAMEDVAREAGVGKGTLCRHYPTKYDLFVAILEEGVEQLSRALTHDIPPEADAETKLRCLTSIYLRLFAEEHCAYGELMYSLRAEGQHVQDAIVARLRLPAWQAMRARVHGIFAQGIREGAFRPLDLDFITSAYFSLVGPGGYGKMRSLLSLTHEELEERLLDFILAAVRAPHGTANADEVKPI